MSTEAENRTRIANAEAIAQAKAVEAERAAEAQAKRASQVGATDLGKQLALLGTYAGIVQKSNEGVSKVVYCDPALRPGNPLGLMTLDGLAGEMQTLQGSLGGK